MKAIIHTYLFVFWAQINTCVAALIFNYSRSPYVAIRPTGSSHMTQKKHISTVNLHPLDPQLFINDKPFILCIVVAQYGGYSFWD